MAGSVTDDDLERQVAELDWYHTFELAPGLETPGWFDLREIVHRVPLPPSLAGRRCLDVGTFDGFWAFEMERRGAEEVVAIDVLEPTEWDWPVRSDAETIAAIGRRKAQGRGFELVHRTLGSAVERLELSVYELDPEILGRFDLVYLGSLLLHLRDPVRALERVRSVCAGELIVVDAIDAPLTALLPRRPVARLDGHGRPWWWRPNLAGLARMVEAGGFALSRDPARLRMPPGRGHPAPRPSPRMLRSRAGRELLMHSWRGDPHAIVVAKPEP